MYIRKDKNLMGMEGSERYFETFMSRGRVKLASSTSRRWNCTSREVRIQNGVRRSPQKTRGPTVKLYRSEHLNA
jgi:hypothetical protein